MPRYSSQDPVTASELRERDDIAYENHLSDLEQQDRDKDCDKPELKNDKDNE